MCQGHGFLEQSLVEGSAAPDFFDLDDLEAEGALAFRMRRASGGVSGLPTSLCLSIELTCSIACAVSAIFSEAMLSQD